MEITDIKNTVQLYSIEEIAEYNDVLVEDLLETLVEDYNWKLPEPRPL
jgi:hypothetical protein